MTRQQFDAALRAWLGSAPAAQIGIGDGRRGQSPWVWVRSDAGDLCHLNANTTRDGVSAYVALAASGPSREWGITRSRRGTETKVGFGPERRVVPGFYLYRPPAG